MPGLITLVPGRFHVVTRGLAGLLREAPSPVTVAVCASDRSGTRRNPLPVHVREAMLRAVRPDVAIVRVPDFADDARWAAAVLEAVGGPLRVRTANTDVAERFRGLGIPVDEVPLAGAPPSEVLARIADGTSWEGDVPPEVYAVLAPHCDAIAQVCGRTVVNPEGELAHARDFDTYGAQMDASLAQKLDDLLPWVVPGRIVDKGCGTGRLVVELSRRFPDSAFVGVDLSREFLRRCEENTYHADDVALVMGDARHAAVPDGTATTVILSSIVHEIWTYSGYDRAAVTTALASAARELAPGGRLLVRDGVSPGRAPWRLRFLDAATRGWFERFATEFRHGQGAPFERLGPDEVRLPAHFANEFLCKKDYQKNWHIEVHEEFGTFTVDEWRELLRGAGLAVREVRAYLNPWIVRHRYEGSAVVTDDAGRPLPWPATNVVVVGERR